MTVGDFFGFFKRVFALVQEEHQNKKALTELEEEVDRMSRALQRLSDQVEHNREVENLEREKLLMKVQHENETLKLQLNNLLTHFEHRLPPNK